MSKILVTGAAGFIGFHLSRRLVEDGNDVVGVDNLNPYYDVSLKEARLALLVPYKNFRFVKLDLAEQDALSTLFAINKFDVVVNLAAQAGVRHSIHNPYAYINNNVVGFMNILEACRQSKVKHLVFASSSSVYGANVKLPFSVRHNVDHPVSLYAATKKANELMAHSYAALFQLPCTGLRFFTVYGPWGRPDMAYYLFTKAILRGECISIFNEGHVKRDFTYIGDVVEGIARIMKHVPIPDKEWDGNNPDPASSFAPYRIHNIGNNQPISVMRLIKVIEDVLGVKAEKKFLPMQAGDLVETFADVESLTNEIGFTPSTTIELGMRAFIQWYREYYGV